MNLSELLKLWRVEKASSTLGKLNPQFYQEAHELLNGKDKFEAEKAKGIYNDLVYMRQHKMLMSCLRQMRGGEKPENLLASEREHYNKIIEELNRMLEGNVEVVEAPQQQLTDESQETLADLEVEVGVEKQKGHKLEMETAPALEPEEAVAVAVETENGGEEVFKGKTENKALRRVRFLRPMPAFIGPDLQTLGPFDEDEVSELDGDVVEILLKNDAVELM